MPRKRGPLIVAGRPVEIDAPGLSFRHRANGARQAYWVATEDAIARGYLPKTVRFFYDLDRLDDVQRLAADCRRLQAEMAEWLDNPEVKRKLIYDGTLGALIRLYQDDPESPFHATSQNTQRGYRDWCSTLYRMFGARRLDKLIGQDFRKWYSDILEPGARGAPRVRLAYCCIRSMMKILLDYGVELDLPNCSRLSDALAHMEFRPPRATLERWKASRPRKVPMTYDQAKALVEAGIAKGTRRHLSAALGVAAQFEFTMRQIDVIGQWEKIDKHRAVEKGEIVSRGQVWRPGMTHEQFASGTYDLTTSKNATQAMYDVTAYPLFQRALEAVKAEWRRGSLVVDESGIPIRQRYYQDLYRELAKAAGVPLEVWNARARHGGLTEGYNAIADRSGDGSAGLADLKYHGQHTDLGTTLNKYVTPGTELSKRVARARVAHRAKKESA